MNSTLRYCVRKIVSETTSFVLSLELAHGHSHWVFPNAQCMYRRKKAVGVEFEENELWAFLCGQSRLVKADSSVSGTYVLNSQSTSRISFNLDCSHLFQGSYVLISPSWGRHSKRKMWLLIPSLGRQPRPAVKQCA